LGVQNLMNASYSYYRSDGGATGAASFGAPNFNDVNVPLVGVLGKLTLLRTESKTVATSLDVTGGIRFVSFPDDDVFGTQEANTTKVPQDAIEPQNGYNTFVVRAGLNVGF
jgi:hypothetical protein